MGDLLPMHVRLFEPNNPEDAPSAGESRHQTEQLTSKSELATDETSDETNNDTTLVASESPHATVAPHQPTAASELAGQAFAASLAPQSFEFPSVPPSALSPPANNSLGASTGAVGASVDASVGIPAEPSSALAEETPGGRAMNLRASPRKRRRLEVASDDEESAEEGAGRRRRGNGAALAVEDSFDAHDDTNNVREYASSRRHLSTSADDDVSDEYVPRAQQQKPRRRKGKGTTDRAYTTSARGRPPLSMSRRYSAQLPGSAPPIASTDNIFSLTLEQQQQQQQQQQPTLASVALSMDSGTASSSGWAIDGVPDDPLALLAGPSLGLSQYQHYQSAPASLHDGVSDDDYLDTAANSPEPIYDDDFDAYFRQAATGAPSFTTTTPTHTHTATRLLDPIIDVGDVDVVGDSEDDPLLALPPPQHQQQHYEQFPQPPLAPHLEQQQYQGQSFTYPPYSHYYAQSAPTSPLQQNTPHTFYIPKQYPPQQQQQHGQYADYYPPASASAVAGSGTRGRGRGGRRRRSTGGATHSTTVAAAAATAAADTYREYRRRYTASELDDELYDETGSGGGGSGSGSSRRRYTGDEALDAATLEKRRSHNVLERKRRDDLNRTFNTLQLAIPSLANRHPVAKIIILREALNHILYLKRKDAAYLAEKTALRNERQLLTARLRALRAAAAARS